MEVRVICIQPVRMNIDLYEHLMLYKSKYENIFENDFNDKFESNWLQNFRARNRKFQCWKSVKKLSNVSNTFLSNDLKNTGLSGYLNVDKTSYDILFDTRLFQTVIIYDLHFDIPKSDLNYIINQSITPSVRGNFYKLIRQALVKEENNSPLGLWARQIRNDSTRFIFNTFCKNLPKQLKIEQDQSSSIENNTGNITFHFKVSPEQCEFSSKILLCNQIAELKKFNRTTIENNKNLVYAFHGRFHTIISNDSRTIFQYFPIQMHAQYVWFFTNYHMEVVDKLRLDSSDAQKYSRKKFLKFIKITDECVHKAEMLNFSNEAFKVGIELDRQDVYEKIEAAWGIELAVAETRNNAGFRDYLDRGYNSLVEQSTRRQNNILFLISCMQILSLVSIWSDYLGLNKIKEFEEKTGLIKDSDGFITLISTWSPILLGGLIVVMFFYVFLKQD